jgi:aminoglycoside phosphotransferase (APT) family kinase protein
MERINRPNDNLREILCQSHIERICNWHGLPQPQEIIPEARGNEKVIYYLDHHFILAFCWSRRILQSDIESLAVLERIDAMPIPGVIAQIKEAPDIHVPYIIVERCPGTRLDELWNKTSHTQRLQVLEALGAGMGRYHTVGGAEVTKVADKLSLSHCVLDLTIQSWQERPWQDAERRAQIVADRLGQLSACLSLFGLEASTVMKQLEAHYTQRLSQPWRSFIGVGLVHGEPWAEHFIIESTEEGYRLSGCVDFEQVFIADSLHEMVFLYVSMLGLNGEYYQAFKRGYEHFFAFPDDAEEELRLAAIDFDAWSLVELSRNIEKPPVSGWLRGWVEKHFHRLVGWLELSKRIDRAMFRREIGPY